MNTLTQDYAKMKIHLRGRLQGLGFNTALRAMDFAESYHTGTRKDGQPEFSHQVSQAMFILTLLPHIKFPEETICVIFLHDVCEDYDVQKSIIKELFGKRVAKSVWLMSKVRKENGESFKISNDIYYEDMKWDIIASICKGADRVHNLMTMIGGFSESKQKEYIQETMDFVVPMLKRSRRMFPEQADAYENVKFVMTNQIQIYNAMHDKVAQTV